MQVEVPAQFSVDELVEALRQTEGQDGRGLSAEEISRRVGRSVDWVRKRLRALQGLGRLAPVQWRTSYGLDGRVIKIPVYSLRKEQ